MPVTDCMGLIRKTMFMVPFPEHTAFRISRWYRNLPFSGLPAAGIPIKSLFPMCPAVFIDLSQKLLPIGFRRRRDRFFHFLMDVCVCFDMGSIHKYNFWGKITALLRLKKDPGKHLFYSVLAESVPKVITDGGKMGDRFIEQISQKHRYAMFLLISSTEDSLLR